MRARVEKVDVLGWNKSSVSSTSRLNSVICHCMPIWTKWEAYSGGGGSEGDREAVEDYDEKGVMKRKVKLAQFFINQ